MAFERYGENVSFADLGLRKTLASSRTQRILSGITEAITRGPVRKSHFGNHAYPPIMLLRAVLLQKWFGIHSDPELANQINDRRSFKIFIGFPLKEIAAYTQAGSPLSMTYAIVSKNRCVKLPESVRMDVAALLGRAVLTGAGIILNTIGNGSARGKSRVTDKGGSGFA